MRKDMRQSDALATQSVAAYFLAHVAFSLAQSGTSGKVLFVVS